jgi:hypothetical protein
LVHRAPRGGGGGRRAARRALPSRKPGGSLGQRAACLMPRGFRKRPFNATLAGRAAGRDWRRVGGAGFEPLKGNERRALHSKRAGVAGRVPADVDNDGGLRWRRATSLASVGGRIKQSGSLGCCCWAAFYNGRERPILVRCFSLRDCAGCYSVHGFGEILQHRRLAGGGANVVIGATFRRCAAARELAPCNPAGGGGAVSPVLTAFPQS